MCVFKRFHLSVEGRQQACDKLGQKGTAMASLGKIVLTGGSSLWRRPEVGGDLSAKEQKEENLACAGESWGDKGKEGHRRPQGTVCREFGLGLSLLSFLFLFYLCIYLGTWE